MLSREDLHKKLAGMLLELFDIPLEKVVPQALLYEDLDLDSIDAVDLIVQLQTMTQRRIKPEEFKAVRSVSHVLDCLEQMQLSEPINV